jgi:3-methyladenine DNA glycosylase AlkD
MARSTKSSGPSRKVTAAQFVKKLKAGQSAAELEKIKRYFKSGEGAYAEDDKFIGVRMGQVFALAKEFIEMPLDEIEKLLESPIHEARAGALSIMGKQARGKMTTPERRKELFDLYIRRHDRVNNWDLVDLGALYVVGIYLVDKPRDILYDLARSKNIWERRTAIVGTGHLIRQGDVADTFKIAALLLKDEEDLIHKGTGWMLRAAGDSDRKQLLGFLDEHAATMPRTLLRYSIEKLDKKQREYYMKMKRVG